MSRTNTQYKLQYKNRRQKFINTNFEIILLESIDEGFSKMSPNRQSIYSILQNNFKIKKKDIPYKIEQFSEAIEKIFGPSAKLIEIAIIKAIHNRIQNFIYFPLTRDLIFSEYVANLRSSLKLLGH